MNSTDRELIAQTEKWLEKLKKEREKVKVERPSKGVATAMKNLDAYISDASHFIEKKDYIRAFEAVIYAWGIIETLRWLGMV